MTLNPLLYRDLFTEDVRGLYFYSRDILKRNVGKTREDIIAELSKQLGVECPSNSSEESTSIAPNNGSQSVPSTSDQSPVASLQRRETTQRQGKRYPSNSGCSVEEENNGSQSLSVHSRSAGSSTVLSIGSNVDGDYTLMSGLASSSDSARCQQHDRKAREDSVIPPTQRREIPEPTPERKRELDRLIDEGFFLHGNHAGKCRRCNTPLKDSASILLGIGPECRKKVGSRGS